MRYIFLHSIFNFHNFHLGAHLINFDGGGEGWGFEKREGGMIYGEG